MVRIRLSLALAAICICAAAPAAAHDWYPRECCGGQDCAPVEHSYMLGGTSDSSGMLVTTKHGMGIVPPNMTRRESKDHRMHACLRRSWLGSIEVICIFVPPSM